MSNTLRIGLAVVSLCLLIASTSASARGAEAGSQNDWPEWRGPLGNGTAPAADPPTNWSETQNVRWKVKLPGRGTATPIVSGDAVFIQTAIASAQKSPGPTTAPAAAGGGRRGGGGAFAASVEEPSGPVQFVLLCLDRRTGQTRWQKVVREEVPHEGHHKEHGFASYSPVTDGKLVYAYFGSRGLHCLDFDGNLKWSKDLGRLQIRNAFGEGSSPALYGDSIVIKWDHEGADFVAAFDKTTGEERWRTPRDENTNWSTPLIVEHDGKAQVVTTATGRVRSYDMADGKQIWEAPGLTANAIPTPVAGNGMVYVTSGFRGSSLYAVKLGPGASGDLSGKDAIVWSAKKGTPYVPSPLLYGDRLYIFSVNSAILSCFDANTGNVLIDTQRIDDLENVYSSPVGAAGRVYLVGRNGATVVMRNLTGDSRKVEVLATNQLDEHFDASPAVAGKELFLRGQENLYCIAAP